MTSSKRRLVFGLYPGGMAGGDTGLLSGPPDDQARVKSCLDELQGNCRPFVVRCYDSFQDPDSPLAATPCAPLDYLQYAIPAVRPLELVLQFRSASGNVSGFVDFVRWQLERSHAHLYSVQITEEANFADGPPVIDGRYPDVLRALTEGVVAAKELLRALGRPEVKVGFNATPTFGPSAQFWNRLAGMGERLVESLDYGGLDFFPDVFRRVAPDGQPGDLRSSVTGVLETMRSVWLPAAGIPNRVPIHIAEHGWPTGAGRHPERQAEVLDTVIRTVHDLADRLNIERYMLFALRDVEQPRATNENNLFCFFGIATADYAHKPAFGAFRSLIQELGRQ
ncbi:MAG TPA: hypothetical protein VN924_03915 [Bryobacteraceae bacterium]|nr:hypothetical protein [Bryobacteraceae bacterium]